MTCYEFLQYLIDKKNVLYYGAYDSCFPPQLYIIYTSALVILMVKSIVK